jgi:hypothetical protein
MGWFDSWCPLCGAPLNDIPENIKNNKWLTDVIILLSSGENLYNMVEIGSNATFTDKQPTKKSKEIAINDKNGLPVHADCFKLFKRSTKKTLTYKDFSDRGFIDFKGDVTFFALEKFNYPRISKYWAQFFNYETLIKNNDNYLLVSPLHSPKNAERIKKNFSKLTKKVRPSPNESATKFKLGKKKKGNSGDMYVVVQNKNGVKRWKKIKL